MYKSLPECCAGKCTFYFLIKTSQLTKFQKWTLPSPSSRQQRESVGRSDHQHICGWIWVSIDMGAIQELRDGHREFEVYIYLQKGCIIVSGVESS